MPKPENVINKGKKFSKDYQPSPEAKSKGKKAWSERAKLKDDLFHEFVKPVLDLDGKEMPTFEKGIKLYKDALFEPNSKLSDKERAELFMKFCDFIGINEQKVDQKVTIDDSSMEGIKEFYKAAITSKSNRSE